MDFKKSIKKVLKEKFCEYDFHEDIHQYEWCIFVKEDIFINNIFYDKGDIIIAQIKNNKSVLYNDIPEFEKIWKDILRIINREKKLERILI